MNLGAAGAVRGQVGDVEVGAGLIAALGSHEATMRRALDRASDRTPRPVQFHGSGVFATGANLLIVPRPFGPSEGRLWHVRFVGVTGSQPVANAAVAGTAHFFIGPEPFSAAAGDIGANWFDATATAFPVSGEYGDWEHTVRHPYGVYVIVTGGTNTVVYQVNGQAKDEALAVPGALEAYGL